MWGGQRATAPGSGGAIVMHHSFPPGTERVHTNGDDHCSRAANVFCCATSGSARDWVECLPAACLRSLARGLSRQPELPSVLPVMMFRAHKPPPFVRQCSKPMMLPELVSSYNETNSK